MSSAAQIAKLIDEFPSDAALEAYKAQFNELCGRNDTLAHFIHLSYSVKLKGSKFRGLAWKLFLGVLGPNREHWIQESIESRKEFKALAIVHRLHEKSDPEINPENGDPLSNEEDCKDDTWRNKFKDEDLRALIKQDVDRTIPEVAFFQSTKVRNLMCEILFVYAKIDPKISYKQGMHEILAPLIFVLHCDAAATQHLSTAGELPQELIVISNGDELKSDCFVMFRLLMERCRKWYLDPEKGGLDATSELEYYIRDLYHNQLKAIDIELYRHLERHHILPQVYGVRWLRLLFGREFPMQDLLCVWDFLIGSNLTYVNSFFVAMLVEQRVILLNGDAGHILTNLMRYPSIDDISIIIEQTKSIHNKTTMHFATSKTKKTIEKSKAQLMNSISTIYSKIDKGLKDIVDTSDANARREAEVIDIKKYKKMTKQLEDNRQMSLFCAARLDRAVDQLSSHFISTQSDGEALVALATVKQVRDFLCGSLKWKDHQKNNDVIHPATIQWLEAQLKTEETIEQGEEIDG